MPQANVILQNRNKLQRLHVSLTNFILTSAFPTARDLATLGHQRSFSYFSQFLFVAFQMVLARSQHVIRVTHTHTSLYHHASKTVLGKVSLCSLISLFVSLCVSAQCTGVRYPCEQNYIVGGCP